MRGLFIVLLAVSLSACGFQLRGSYSLPWETLHLGMNEHTPMYQQIKRSLHAATQTRIVDNARDAQASLIIVSDTQARDILSLTAKGRVREFQLSRSFVFRVVDAAGRELIPASPIVLLREMTFDDEQVFAKEAEENMIRAEMENDLVQQLLRRLSAASRTPRS